MMIRAKLSDDVYDDEMITHLLSKVRCGPPGISDYQDGPEWRVVWCDELCIPRATLVVEQDWSGMVTGSDFCIFVERAYRRRGIATALYKAACSYYWFELDQDQLYTRQGAAWARAIKLRDPNGTGKI